ncbi:MAG: formate dehydrogenase accessory sulfurtransferase FdhD [Actinomycetota bacterium]|nr:formate dehydrogenase accessory sulfurtransferase FdhD [Actinomycetota bacterium]
MTGSGPPGRAGEAATLDLAVTAGRVPTSERTVYEGEHGTLRPKVDRLAVEEPLEIRLTYPGGDSRRTASTLSVTMRTPGHDVELVAGFLLSEGIVSGTQDIRSVAYCLDREIEPEQRYNVVTADLRRPPAREVHARNVVTSSACGVCGSASIEAACGREHPAVAPGPLVARSLLARLPGLLSSGQRGFAATGGLHAAALVRSSGEVLALREDVGRHNAVDKVVGWALLDGGLPAHDAVLVVSGRVSFEIVQKALQAGVSFVAAVSAATSLAARLAGETGMTLVGFVRGDRCTVYSGRERILEG